METPNETIVLSRREYHREYQRKRRVADPEKARKYQRSLEIKKRFDLGDDMWKKYKHHLNDVIKFTTLARQLPREFVLEIIENLPEEPAEEPAEEHSG